MRQQGGSKFAHLYRTARWQATRRQQLDREPLCCRCKRRGKDTLATVCNHTNGHPAGETEEQFWAGPFDSQCAPCHSGDTAREEQGKAAKGCDASGWPLARSHEQSHHPKSEAARGAQAAIREAMDPSRGPRS